MPASEHGALTWVKPGPDENAAGSLPIRGSIEESQKTDDDTVNHKRAQQDKEDAERAWKRFYTLGGIGWLLIDDPG